MNIIYKSLRVGKNGKIFSVHKFKTLKDSSNKSPFAHQNEYTKFGWILRKTHLDEAPQLWNIVKRDMNFFGPRPEEASTIEAIPKETKEILLSVRPGMLSLSALYFSNEEEILKISSDPFKDYWMKIKPMKIMLDIFYIHYKGFWLNVWILYTAIKLFFKSLII